MAIINSYPLATPKLTDLVLGTSASSTGQTSTKSFTIQSMRDATSGVKTITTTTPTTLAISGTTDVTINTITAAVTDGGTGLATGNDIYDFVVGKITGTANTVPIWTGAGPSTTLGNSLISQANNGVIISGNLASQIDGKLTLNCYNGNHGVTIQAPSHSASATYTLILPTVSNPGAGKVLTSGAGTTNQLSWTDNGNVGGTGTDNKLSKWSGATTLTDSNVADTGTLVTISGAAKVTGNLELDADLLDVNGNTGSNGQLLSSLGTGNGVDWIPAPATGVASLSTTNTNLITITSPGSTPHTGAVVATPNISGGVSLSSDTLATGTEIQAAINTALAGAVTFKGTFNASTGQITGGSNYLYNPGANSNTIAVAVGDMYIVSVAGNFFGNASTGLNVGDEVIAVTQSTISPSNSQESYYNAVPSAGGGVTDVTSGNTTAIGITPTTGSVVVTSNAYAGGTNVGHVPTGGSAGKYLDGASGAWTTLPTGDTYDLNAATNGSNVDINLTSGSGTDDSTVKLTAGTGMTITQSGGNNITLDAASGGGTKTVGTVASVAAGQSTHALGVTVTKTPLVNYVDLYISGVYQSKTSYTITGGNTITLTGATFPTGALIESVTTT